MGPSRALPKFCFHRIRAHMTFNALASVKKLHSVVSKGEGTSIRSTPTRDWHMGLVGRIKNEPLNSEEYWGPPWLDCEGHTSCK